MKKHYTDLSIILPTYNESGNIVLLIRELLKQTENQSQIIVVDDNSPDKTFEVAKKAFSRNTNVHIYKRIQERGLATAILYGIKKSITKKVLVMDTDFNHDPKEILPMLELSQKHDLVIGSRYISSGGMENKVRQWLSYAFNIYLRMLLGHGVKDNLSGFFIMDRKKILNFPTDQIFYGFGDYFIRLIYTAYTKKMKITETPVFYKNRTYGVSKSQFIPMFIEYTKSALKLRFS